MVRLCKHLQTGKRERERKKTHRMNPEQQHKFEIQQKQERKEKKREIKDVKQKITCQNER